MSMIRLTVSSLFLHGNSAEDATGDQLVLRSITIITNLNTFLFLIKSKNGQKSFNKALCIPSSFIVYTITCMRSECLKLGGNYLLYSINLKLNQLLKLFVEKSSSKTKLKNYRNFTNMPLSQMGVNLVRNNSILILNI